MKGPSIGESQKVRGLWYAVGIWVKDGPGMGKLIIDSIQALDRPVMVGYLMLVALLFTTINLVADLLYALLDPRLRSRRT